MKSTCQVGSRKKDFKYKVNNGFVFKWTRMLSVERQREKKEKEVNVNPRGALVFNESKVVQSTVV